MRRSCSPLHSLVLALSLLLVAQTASASRFFGVGPNCAYPNIQAAITALLNFSKTLDPCGFDHEIFLVGGTTYTEPLTIDSSGISRPANFAPCQGALVQITGGFDQTCDNPDPNNPISTISATATHSVLNIRGNAAVFLNNLFLTNGSPALDGGGINFHDSSTSGVPASGYLDLTNVTLANNKAGFGGGMFAKGNSPGIVITLHHDTFVKLNTATQSGGGIDIEGNTYLTALEDNILIEHNTASGNGGGLRLVGAVADIGSPGSSTFNQPSVINSNHANNGGGIATEFDGNVYGGFRLFSTVAGKQVKIEHNSANNQGGGIYTSSSGICASGYGINNNIAGTGSAIYMFDNNISGVNVDFTSLQLQDSDGSSNFACGGGHPLPTIARCPAGNDEPCNSINNNGNSTADVLIAIDGPGFGKFVADRFEMRGNTGSFLVASSIASSVEVDNCLMADNQLGLGLITATAGNFTINGCTIGGNVVTNGGVLIQMGSTDKIFTLANSILAFNDLSSGATPASLFLSHGSLHVSDVLASETASLTAIGQPRNVNSFDPKFVDPANRNYHLKPESPAIDYHVLSNPVATPASDLDDNPRGQAAPNLRPPQGADASPYDIGAYEFPNPRDVIFADDMDGIL